VTFLAPFFLRLLPLALAPVMFHLFFRLRWQPRLFPSLMFFLAADPRLSARRRLREWLLLALRCLMLLALLLALARPARRGHGGGKTTLVTVLDNSASMSAAGRDGCSRLGRATAAAAALIEDADVALAGVMTTVADPQATPPAGLTADRAALRAALAAMRPTHAAGDGAHAGAGALARLRGTAGGPGEVHLFTDLQAAEWGLPAVALELPPGVVLTVHDLGDDGAAPGTATIAGVDPPARPTPAGRPWRATVRLRNAGEEQAEVILDAEAAPAGERRRQAVSLREHEERIVTLDFKGLPAPGLARLHCRLEGRAAAPAAESWLALAMPAGVPVVLLGDAGEHGLLAAALAPLGTEELTGLKVVTPAAGEWARGNAAAGAAMVAATAAQLAAAEVAGACRTHVENGGVLLVTPGPEWPPAKCALPEWCGASWGGPREDEAGLPWVVLAPEADVWDELRDSQGEPRWRGVLAHRALTLDLGTAEAVAGLHDGTPLLAVNRLGAGKVCLSGVAWHPRWSNLPRKAAFPALVQGMALGGMRGDKILTAVAGRPLAAADAARPGERTVEVRAVAGETGAWQADADRLRAPPRAGIYEIGKGSATRILAVGGEPAEAEPRRLQGGQLPLLAHVPHHIVRDKDAVSAVAAARAARHGRSLFGPLLLLAAAAMLAEAAVARA
jgi:hypothetical protein